MNNENGYLYQWYLGGLGPNIGPQYAGLLQSIRLFNGATVQPYTPTEIGPTGEIFASSLGQLIAVGVPEPDTSVLAAIACRDPWRQWVGGCELRPTPAGGGPSGSGPRRQHRSAASMLVRERSG